MIHEMKLNAEVILGHLLFKYNYTENRQMHNLYKKIRAKMIEQLQFQNPNCIVSHTSFQANPQAYIPNHLQIGNLYFNRHILASCYRRYMSLLHRAHQIITFTTSSAYMVMYIQHRSKPHNEILRTNRTSTHKFG